MKKEGYGRKSIFEKTTCRSGSPGSLRSWVDRVLPGCCTDRFFILPRQGPGSNCQTSPTLIIISVVVVAVGDATTGKREVRGSCYAGWVWWPSNEERRGCTL